MKIGVLTFLHVSNFGANLQAFSTYMYLKNHGHEPVYLDYSSEITEFYKKMTIWKRHLLHQPLNPQDKEHLHFVDKMIDEQIHGLKNISDVRNAVVSNDLDGVIIGSDAVVQHWPIASTWKMGKNRPLWIEPMQPERRFPNPFWGCGFANEVPTAMMSVSSQNSKYFLFGKHTLKKMAGQLNQMTYISVRDAWTKDMMHKADPALTINVTPDPVFALNQNASKLLSSEETLREKYDLPSHYVLVGLRSQVFSKKELAELDELMRKEGKCCVAFCIDGLYNYEHPFKYQIPIPISPLDWFALIKYADAYVGSNMHPIVSCLSNVVPCYSLDNWGATDFWGKKIHSQSSKVYDILNQFELGDYITTIEEGKCNVTINDIVDHINAFPIEKVKMKTQERLKVYNTMMESILSSFKK